MPTRKQRRRRQKDRRHEYEYVYVDDEGNEVDADEIDVDAPQAKSASRNGRARPAAGSPGARIQPPSWRRVAKRGAVFAPIMFLTVMFLDRGLALWQIAIQTLWLMAIFLPFSYFLDSWMYRRYQRRTGGPDPRGAKR